MTLLQHSEGPWYGCHEVCGGESAVDARSLTGSVVPVVDPYVFKTRVVVPPTVLASLGAVTCNPFAALELRRTVNFGGAGQTLLDSALSPASGWVSIQHGNAPILVAQFDYLTAPTLPASSWIDVATPSLVFGIGEGPVTTAIRG